MIIEVITYLVGLLNYLCYIPGNKPGSSAHQSDDSIWEPLEPLCAFTKPETLHQKLPSMVGRFNSNRCSMAAVGSFLSDIWVSWEYFEVGIPTWYLVPKAYDPPYKATYHGHIPVLTPTVHPRPHHGVVQSIGDR